MKTIFAVITFVALGLGTSFAQNSNNDPQMSVNNYKHANKAKKATDKRADMTGQEVSLRSQRTNKAVKRNYVLAPANANTATNVQGQKNKANYKSQFN